MYNRFNEAAHPRELVEEKVSCVTQQNVCLDSHISYLTKVYIYGSSMVHVFNNFAQPEEGIMCCQ